LGGHRASTIFLTGLGDNAHVFDTFAPKFTATYHVYGITRRGFGASSAPVPTDSNYSADRLGDDVLAVIDALKINRPVLVGHSIAGEELSSIGSRRPDKVAALIYLDAGNSYAFYDRSRGDLQIDANDMRKKLDRLPGMGPLALKPTVNELLQTDMPQLQKDLQNQQRELQAFPNISPQGDYRVPPVLKAIEEGEQRYTEIKCPILALFAVPHDLGHMTDNAVAQAAAESSDLVRTTANANAFEAGIPSAHVVRLPKANHYVFRSNEADVLREMNAFLAKLPS
jgi:pimeloyl-ACP methyl ester carboxylesterase